MTNVEEKKKKKKMGSLGFSVPAEGVANLGVPQMYLQLGGYVCWLIYGTFWG